MISPAPPNSKPIPPPPGAEYTEFIIQEFSIKAVSITPIKAPTPAPSVVALELFITTLDKTKYLVFANNPAPIGGVSYIIPFNGLNSKS